MSGPKRPGAPGSNDRDAADEAVKGSDDDVTVDGADAAESGYRRDDYWRQQQQGLPPDAGTRSRDEPDDGSA